MAKMLKEITELKKGSGVHVARDIIDQYSKDIILKGDKVYIFEKVKPEGGVMKVYFKGEKEGVEINSANLDAFKVLITIQNLQKAANEKRRIEITSDIEASKSGDAFKKGEIGQILDMFNTHGTIFLKVKASGEERTLHIYNNRRDNDYQNLDNFEILWR